MVQWKRILFEFRLIQNGVFLKECSSALRTTFYLELCNHCEAYKDNCDVRTFFYRIVIVFAETVARISSIITS